MPITEFKTYMYHITDGITDRWTTATLKSSKTDYRQMDNSKAKVKIIIGLFDLRHFVLGKPLDISAPNDFFSETSFA